MTKERQAEVLALGLALTFIILQANAQENTTPTQPGATPSAADAILDAINVYDLRDPFVPVNYAPPEPVPIPQPSNAKVDAPSQENKAPTPAPAPAPTPALETIRPGIVDWAAAISLLKVSGVSIKAGKSLASIENVGFVEPGDIISLHHRGIAYKWRVSEIRETGIKTEQVSATPIR